MDEILYVVRDLTLNWRKNAKDKPLILDHLVGHHRYIPDLLFFDNRDIYPGVMGIVHAGTAHHESVIV